MKTAETPFRFKQFTVWQDQCAMKITADGCLLGAWSGGGKEILDVGTGTGLLSLMLAQRYPDARITALEIEPLAAEQAGANFRCSAWSRRIQPMCGSFADFLPTTAITHIIANPPYFSSGLAPDDPSRSLARHSSEFDLPLLFSHGKEILTNDGIISTVYPADSPVLPGAAIAFGFHPRRLTQILPLEGRKATRNLWEFSRKAGQFERDTLILMNPDNRRRTLAYWRLLKDYYLDC